MKLLFAVLICGVVASVVAQQYYRPFRSHSYPRPPSSYRTKPSYNKPHQSYKPKPTYSRPSYQSYKPKPTYQSYPQFKPSGYGSYGSHGSQGSHGSHGSQGSHGSPPGFNPNDRPFGSQGPGPQGPGPQGPGPQGPGPQGPGPQGPGPQGPGPQGPSGGGAVDGNHGSSEYHYSWIHKPGKMVWDEANAYCTSLGGGWAGVSINDHSEGQFIYSVIGGQEYIWTSGQGGGNSWRWANGMFNNVVADWSHTGQSGRSQPDNAEGNENCLAILNNFYNDGLKWHDIACHHPKPIVCERS